MNNNDEWCGKREKKWILIVGDVITFSILLGILTWWIFDLFRDLIRIGPAVVCVSKDDNERIQQNSTIYCYNGP